MSGFIGAAFRRGKSMLGAFLRGRRGNVALEFAFVAPLVITLMGACIDYGQAIEAKILLTNAAAAGAQYASQSSANAQNTAGIRAAVRGAANDTQNSISVTASLACNCPDGTTVACGTGTCAAGGPPMQQSIVTASENFTAMLAMPFFTGAVPLSASATMPVVR